MAKKRSNGEGTIYQRKDGRWTAQYSTMVDGVLKRKTVYGKTQKEVKTKLKNLQTKAESQTFFEEDKDMLFQDWMKTWLMTYKKPMLKITTYENYIMNYSAHIVDSKIGKCPINKLTVSMLQQYYNNLALDGRSDGKGKLSNRTVRYISILIAGALDQAVKNGLVERNLSKLTVLPKKVKAEIKPLTVSEVKEILKASRGTDMYLVYLLAISCGMRRGEILGLRWEDIDFTKRLIMVQKSVGIVKNDGSGEKDRKHMLILQDPKSLKSKRSIPIDKSLVEELKMHRLRQEIIKKENDDIYNDRGMVFARVDGYYMSPWTLLDSYNRLLKKLGIEHHRFHDLRHTFATILLNENESPKVIQELMGHASVSTTMDIYSHVLEETKVNSIKKIMDKIQ